VNSFAGIINIKGQRCDPQLIRHLTLNEGDTTLADDEALFAQRAGDPGEAAVITDELVILIDGTLYDSKLPSAKALEKAWKHWGPAFVKHVNGDFAALIWDRRSKTAHLFRDYLGVRRLYWARCQDRFCFASDLNNLLAIPGVSRELAREHLAEFLSFRIIHAPRTLIRGVHQLEAAHWLRLRDGTIHNERYWKPEYAPPSMPRPSERATIDALEEHLKASVQRRVDPTAPTGLYFSGGLGSTAIAAVARDMHLMLPSFTVSFDDDPHSESPFAGRIARLLNIDHHGVTAGTPQLAESFEPTVQALGAPNGNPAAILQYQLAKHTAEHTRIALSGDGSVELFGGRMLDRLGGALKIAHTIDRLPAKARNSIRNLLGRVESARAFVTPPQQYGLALALGGANLFNTEDRQRVLRHPYLVRPNMREQVLSPYYSDLVADPINAVLHAYLSSQLVEDALLRAERTARPFGLQLRFPLLDRDLFQQVCSLPGSFKLRRVSGSIHSRWPLRALLSGVLPSTLIHRPKRGMPTPGAEWFKGPGRLFFEERFRQLSADPHRLWRIAGLNQLKREALQGYQGAASKLWALFLLDAWLDTLETPS
jgi:asparagine synthase (glutamine-hydrolysing)